MEIDIEKLKHFIDEDNIQAAIEKEKEIETKYDRNENKAEYEKNTEIFELMKYLKEKKAICDIVDKVIELKV